MPRSKRRITEKRWCEAVDAFELGTHNGSQIARQLGVSASAVSRQFRKRGARKGCRVSETVVEFEAELAAKAKRRAQHQSFREAAAWQRMAEINAMVHDMVESLLAAGETGDLLMPAAKVTELRQALRR